jgi:nitroreductase
VYQVNQFVTGEVAMVESPRGGDPLTEAELRDCVRAAVAAPSLHNSQPWRFRLGADHIDVMADRTRRLDALDPSGRELLISVGAAVFNLRVAMALRGRVPAVALFPDPADPDLVARVTAGEAAPPTAELAALAEAIPRRHTNRQPFAREAIPATTLDGLCAAAVAEGATLTVATPAARQAILDLVRTAEHRLRAHGEFRPELPHWTRPVPVRRGRVPSPAFGPWDAMEALPLRDFGLTPPELDRPIEAFEPFPTIVVLGSTGDGREDWVRSGLALQRVLLLATVARLAATPMSQPLEIPALRELVTVPGPGRHAQVILRLGYAPPNPPTGRRPLADVLLP